jgi:membrane protein
VESALKLGVKNLALRSGGFSEETLAGAGAAYVFPSVKDLFDHYDSSPLQDD